MSRPRRELGTRLFLAVLAAGATGGTAGAVVLWGAPRPLSWLVPLVVLSVVARMTPDITVRQVAILLHSIVLLASIPLVGPVGAIIVHALPTAWRYRDKGSRLVFNVASPVLAVVLGSLLVDLVLGRPPHPPSSPAQLAVTLTLLTVTAGLVNALALAAVIRLADGTPASTVLASLAPRITPGYLGYGVAAYLLVVLWALVGLGWFSAVLLLPSLVVAQWSLLQYQRERGVYEAMLDALVEALEIRSPGSRARSELTSRVAGGVAEMLGLPLGEVETISTAARLHDVGLLELPADLLAMSRGAGPEELSALVDHPATGARLIGDVSFLRAAAESVAAHHERVDGRGYPAGLRGESIPLGARVIAVADAWTSFVAPMSGEPGLDDDAAMQRCAELAGTALDEACVEALRQVLHRHPATLEPPERAVQDAGPVASGSRPVDQAHPAMTARVGELVRGGL